ncbi:MAG: DNA gyrase subunit A [Candidatus Coatesbacteria bacterium]|nr:DNA gyrase subunit A [Candidatus Coatesbacteria bacterium]
MGARAQRVIQRDITEEMKTAYLDYAMSVIVSRALPDVCDGLKPVQRRILYAMKDLGLTYNRPYKKCARIVGDTMGKYHPHGDAAIYSALVRMVQDFSLRYPLIDGQGNYGSIDDDPPAAMRYTEARLDRISEEMLADIEKDVVAFVPNYDSTTTEPTVLPARIPNLLINGSSGIAVGMATQVPPHNLGEIVDGLIRLIEHPGITILELMDTIKGPDFPTAAFILGRSGIKQAYETGHGQIIVRAKASFESFGPKDGRTRIVITELPYQRQKNAIVMSIADLVNQKRIEGIADIRDESDREGMRIVVELKRDAQEEVILRQLFKFTALQDSFNVNMLALVQGQPRLLNLKQVLQAFVEFRQSVVRRRCEFDLNKAEARAHILEGLKIAISNLDAVISTIRESTTVEQAQGQLMTRFNLTAIQAKAILDMRLQNLTKLEQEKLDEEFAKLREEIEYLRKVLSDEMLVLGIVKDELKEIRKKYGDVRRTVIVAAEEEVTDEELIPAEEMLVTATKSGYIKRTPLSLFTAQRRSGQGSYGMATKEEDFIESMFATMTHDWVMFFTDRGRVHLLKVYNLPSGEKHAKGRAIRNLLNLLPDEEIRALLPVRGLDFDNEQFLLMATQKGQVKKSPISAFRNIRSNGIAAIGLDEGDSLVSARLTNGSQDVFLGTRNGSSIHFSEEQIRPMGRAAHGVRGIRLREGDEVIGMEVLSETTTILTVTENGYGKRSRASDYRPQNRGGYGLINIRCSKKNGKVVSIVQANDGDEVIMITQNGKALRFKLERQSVRVTSRATMGVRLQSMLEGDNVASVSVICKEYTDQKGNNSKS